MIPFGWELSPHSVFEIGMITPPVGLNLFVLKAITDVPMTSIMTGALPFVFILLAGLILLTVFSGNLPGPPPIRNVNIDFMN